MNSRSRRLLLPFGIVAGGLSVAATAFACGAWVGSLEVTGNAANTGTVRVDGGGTVQGQNGAPKSTFTMSQTIDSGVARVPTTGGTVTVETGHSSVNNSWIPDVASQRTLNPYQVLFYNNQDSPLPGVLPAATGYTGSASAGTRQWETHCMDEGDGTPLIGGHGRRLGEVTIGPSATPDAGKIIAASGGTYSANTATFSLPTLTNTNANGTNESALCIADVDYYYGNQAPVTVL